MLPLRNSIRLRTIPVVTFLLIAANVAVFVYQLLLPEPALQRLLFCRGVVPMRFADPALAERLHCGGSSWAAPFTYMFLHGGWIHLIANMWALGIFGGKVEDTMGHGRFLAFYLLCGALAVLAHVFLLPRSTLPTIGASGAIAGVMGAFFLFAPFAKLEVLVPIFFYPLVVEVPAFLYLLVWMISQLAGASTTLLAGMKAVGGVAFWAHVGGFAAGLALALLLHPRHRHRRPAHA